MVQYSTARLRRSVAIVGNRAGKVCLRSSSRLAHSSLEGCWEEGTAIEHRPRQLQLERAQLVRQREQLEVVRVRAQLEHWPAQ